MRRTPNVLQALLAVSALTALLAGLVVSIRPAQAQASAWSPPRLVFEGEGLVDWPNIFADAYGAVHGLWVVRAEGSNNSPRQIYYVRLDRPNWQPIDIYSYRGPTNSLTALNWAQGLLVTWNGAQYGQSNLAPEVTAKAWRGPYNLGAMYFQPGLATAPDGALWMAFGSNQDNGIYVQRLDPERDTWSIPQLVTYGVTPNTAPDWVRLAFAADGTMHVTWAEYQQPEGFPPQSVQYARSEDGGATWTTPREAAPAGANQPNIVTGVGDEVFISWVGMAGVGGKYVIESLDGGQTWSDRTTIIPPPGGSQGSLLMAADSAGQLHAVVANAGCIWYYTREGAAWSEGECISEPLPTSTLKEFPAMSLGLGNQLHVLFWSDRKQLWYTTRTLDAPALDPQMVPTSPPPTATAVQPTETILPTATYLPDLGPPPSPDAASDAATLALVAGVAPVVLFFLMVAAARVRGRK